MKIISTSFLLFSVYFVYILAYLNEHCIALHWIVTKKEALPHFHSIFTSDFYFFFQNFSCGKMKLGNSFRCGQGTVLFSQWCNLKCPSFGSFRPNDVFPTSLEHCGWNYFMLVPGILLPLYLNIVGKKLWQSNAKSEVD